MTLKLRFRKWVRNFAICLYVRTADWVVPRSVWDDLDQERLDKVERFVEWVNKYWPNDPQVIRLSSLCKFLKDEQDMDETLIAERSQITYDKWEKPNEPSN
jgi:hypothetical protein